MHVDLTGARSRVPWTSVRSYIHRSRVQLTAATIVNIVPSSTPKVLDMLSRCPKLENLALMAAHEQPPDFYAKIIEFRHLKSITCGPDIMLSHGCVGGILSKLPRLEKAAFYHVWDSPSRADRAESWPLNHPNIKSLVIGSSQEDRTGLTFPLVVPGLGGVSFLDSALYFPADNSIQTTDHSYPNLEELRLIWNPARSCSYRFNPVQDGETLPPLRILELRGAAVQQNFYTILPTTLETLRFFSGSIENALVGGFGGNFLTPSGNELPNLSTLIFNDTPWVNLNTLSVFLLQSKAPLRSLHVNLCHNIKGQEFLKIISDPEKANPELANITDLGVACMTDIDDTSVGHLWATLPHLTVLDLSQTKITGCTVRMLADTRNEDAASAKLEVLTIKGCDGVSRDAIDYGRNMGLKILT
jgi:F-box/TPR repeat protein Pof3